jgi:hypothetical protein
MEHQLQATVLNPARKPDERPAYWFPRCTRCGAQVTSGGLSRPSSSEPWRKDEGCNSTRGSEETIRLWEDGYGKQCGQVSRGPQIPGDYSCTMTKGHGGPVHVEMDPVFGLPRFAWLAVLTLLVACGGAAAPPPPKEVFPVEVIVDSVPSPPLLDAPKELRVSLPRAPMCGSKVFNGSCQWEDGRCFSYYGWETEAIQTRTCGEDTSIWSDTPCDETGPCLSRVNFDNSCTVVCDYP